jgi:toxin ParE1/3/4
VDYEVTITPLALRDLEKIRRYIAEDNPLAADSFCQKLLDEAEALKTFPARGGVVPERKGLRMNVLTPYLILYQINEAKKRVQVVRFWHGARYRHSIRH